MHPRLPKDSLAVNCKNISKQFGAQIKAVEDVSLEIPLGTLFGLIGADGAGKTTLIKILATLIKPTKGSAEVLGFDVVKDFRTLRHYIGYVPGKFSLYGDLTVKENLKVFATLYHTTIKANYNLFADIYDQLAPFAKRPAAKLSGGMKQKLALCCALVHRPQILLLDEPTTGVDPVSRCVFWDILARLKEEEGIGIVVSTPYMDEAFRCDRVALLGEGRIISEDRPEKLVQSYPYKLWGATAAEKGKLLKAMRGIEGITSVYSFGESLHFTFDEQLLHQEEIKGLLTVKGINGVTLTPITPSIEDYFLAMTKKSNNTHPKEEEQEPHSCG